METLERILVATVLTAAGLSAAAPPVAASPPDSWTNLRVLDCGSTTLVTHLTPGGFGTPYVVQGSDQVLVPKHVEVVFPGETQPVTTLDVPGFSTAQRATVDCTYVDPQGLQVHLVGLLV